MSKESVQLDSRPTSLVIALANSIRRSSCDVEITLIKVARTRLFVKRALTRIEIDSTPQSAIAQCGSWELSVPQFAAVTFVSVY